MKMKTLLLSTLLISAVAATAQDLPQPSPKGSVEQIVGLTKVKIDYSRPSVKGRKIFGDLVPFEKVWRTGANINTTIEIDGPVMVEGQKLEAGKYSIFTIPGEQAWQVIFNKNVELWGEGDRKPEEDVLTIKVGASKGEHFETLTFLFEEVKDDKAQLQLRWAETKVSIGLHADATEKAMANIKEAVAKPDADFRAYSGSARFLLDRNMDQKLALDYAQKSVSMDKKFWNLHTLALAQAKNGMYKEAVATAEESLKLAQEAKNDAYIKMNTEKIAEWQKQASPAAKPTGKS
jgi:hypothetical protein